MLGASAPFFCACGSDRRSCGATENYGVMATEIIAAPAKNHAECATACTIIAQIVALPPLFARHYPLSSGVIFSGMKGVTHETSA
ncbi:hypothetical protein [Gibbsiella dentisursi]|uniref:hypothetical protein n=1 Tax=Gibbsiella dentisursi TaxID=796890 RepID=UPI0031F914A4